MASAALELLGFFLGLAGSLGTAVAAALPYWRTSAHIGSNIVTAVASAKGLWMECVFQSTGSFQCETYSSLLSLPSDLQASRALAVISLVLSALALAVTAPGMQCTVCLDGSAVKGRVAGAGGGLFVSAGFLALVPVSWTTHEVVQTFYRPDVPSSLKFELGPCLYVGLASSLVTMLGGALLCASCCEGGGRGAPGGRRHGGGYPYPGVAGGARNSARNNNNNPAALLQMGVGVGVGAPSAKGPSPLARSHSGASSQSGPPARDPRHNPAPGYDVTGYV